MTQPNLSAEPRVGLRQVATAAGVGLMTASLALRRNPKISATTTARVRAAADRLGYRPDPEISQLMERLRPARSRRGGVVIALADLRPEGNPSVEPYDLKLHHGAVERAAALNLGVARFRLADYGGQLRRLLQVIRNRGIPGVILLPSSHPLALDPSEEWAGLSVVAATTSIISPRFHRVVPNQLFNLMQLLTRLHGRGYKRIGAVFSVSFERRTAHFFSAALSWYGHRERILIVPDTDGPSAVQALIRAWLCKQTPDLVLAQRGVLEAYPALWAEGGTALVALGQTEDTELAALDERPELIGQSAVSLLAGLMHQHETGIPRHPHTTMIDGVFCEGRSVRRRRLRARPKAKSASLR